MSRKYRDLYEQKVGSKKAVPVTEEENILFRLARMEEDSERLAGIDALVRDIGKKKQGGAPRKTAGDVELAQRFLKESNGDVKLARQAFIKLVTTRDEVEKKRARQRFKDALDILKSPKT
jgi:hypothetical protein